MTAVPPPMEPHRFVLYVGGGSRDPDARAASAEARARRLLNQALPDGFALRVVDVRAAPAEAETARLVATPVLIREFPAPRVGVVGDLIDGAAVLRAFSLG